MILPTLSHPLCGSVLGGISRVFVVPVSQVVSLPDPSAFNMTSDIVLVEGAELIALEMAEESAEFTEESAGGDHGLFYKRKLSLFVPKDAATLSAWISYMARLRDCICLYSDNNGFWKVVGSIDFPVQFGSELVTGKRATTANGHTFTWSGEGLEKAFFHSGFDVATEPGESEAITYATIVDGTGKVLAKVQAGGVFQINRGFSYGFRILS